MPENTTSSTFGRRLREARTASDTTQAALATLVGVTGAQLISRYERGLISPSIDTAVRLADALNVSLDYLTGRTDGDEETQRRLAILAQIEELRSRL
jgi:transcriptional regulator with XRE-family HTH domain